MEKVREAVTSVNYTLPVRFQSTGIDAVWLIAVTVASSALVWAYVQSKRHIGIVAEVIPNELQSSDRELLTR